MKKQLSYYLTILTLAFLSACKAPEDIVYLQNLQDAQQINSTYLEFMRIVPGDKLSIVVTSKNMELGYIFNNTVPTMYTGGRTSVNVMAQTSPFSVDKNGDIEYPVFGTMHVAGLTKHELAGLIKERIIAENYILDPIVTVEYGRTEVSILGEVTTPGVYSLAKERNTIFDALSQAMDLTINGQRADVLVIREDETGHPTSYRIDLTDSKIMESPVYYLQQNDVIYVSPNDQRKRESTVMGNTLQKPTFWLSVITTACTVILLCTRF